MHHFNERKSRLVGALSPQDTVLEIGALNKPSLTKDECSIYFADFTDKNSLIQSYSRYAGFNLEGIVDVDFVVENGDYVGAVRARDPKMTFDLIIGSHVAEHIPDFIGWLLQMYDLLKPGGYVSLIFPDKRFTFDLIKEETKAVDWLTAYESGWTKPSPRQIYRHVFPHLQIGAELSLWDPPQSIVVRAVHSEKEAWEIARSTFSAGSYFDSHCSIVTPATMLQNLVHLEEVGLFPFDLVNLDDTDVGAIDFFFKMQKPHKEKSRWARDYAFTPTARIPYRVEAVEGGALVSRI